MSELALHGGPKAADALEIPTWPQTREQDRENVLDALESGEWCRNNGNAQWVERFEDEWAEYHEAEHAIAVANGTVAIQVALRMCDVRPGDEVLLPPYTFIATGSAITALGAVPKFVDVDPETYNVDPASVEEQITDKTVGMVGVHIAGYPMNFDELLPVLDEHDLFLVEDAAHAQGTEWRGKKIGTFGDVGTFSFQETKSLSAGEGGVVITDDELLAERGHLIHNIGRVSGKAYRHYELAGNCRMTEFQGALLCSQLEQLEAQNETRRENERILREELETIDGVSAKPDDDRITARGYCLFDLKYDPAAFGGLSRDDFLEALNAEGVPGGTGYTYPMYKQPTFSREKVNALVPDDADVPAYRSLHLPGVEEVVATNITFSHVILLAEPEGIRAIGDAIRKIQRNVDELL
ncbi:DegT/DnrJ/EryC1/StrS aminotransferase family protein [Haladaptatus sp. DYSN1]|uniref:DegT/DnrJ/EryC1/StrS family aminotransferase n=2 Tax=Haladaptatus TaxID=367188 RepID=UPI00240510F2|nr:DegT/DnrJ/EryC1/StrS family aminotransferase [Haladaptatus sp. DYSN1]